MKEKGMHARHTVCVCGRTSCTARIKIWTWRHSHSPFSKRRNLLFLKRLDTRFLFPKRLDTPSNIIATRFLT
jgi:hypothetical protein